jgi:hypothetical protein
MMNALIRTLFSAIILVIAIPYVGFAQVNTVNPASGNGSGIITPVVSATETAAAWTANATFKYGLFDAFAGKIGFYIQSDFASLASLELGLGLTRKNIMLATVSGSANSNGYFGNDFESKYWTGANREDIVDFFYDYDNRSVKSGGYLTLTPRINFSSMASFMNSFIGCRFEYRRYNWKADGVLAANELIYNPNQQFSEMERQLNIVFIYGGYYKFGNLLLEIYAGAGTRYYYMKKRDIGIEYKGPLLTPEYGAVLSTFKKTSAMVEVGVNIGISTSGK